MKSNFIFCFFFLCTLAQPLLAQTIDSIDGQFVEFEVGELENLEEGTKLYGRDKNGKKKVILEVTEVDEETVKAKILKGEAKEGYKITTTEASEEGKEETEEKLPKSELFTRREGPYGALGLRATIANQTAQNVTVPGGFIGSTSADSVVTGSGPSYHLEGGYRFKEFILGLEYKLTQISWEKDRSNPVNITELIIFGKFLIGELSIMGGLSPSTSVSKTSSSSNASSIVIGGAYALGKYIDLAFEYHIISVSNTLLNPSHFGLNIVF